jgi:hypothetical protein
MTLIWFSHYYHSRLITPGFVNPKTLICLSPIITQGSGLMTLTTAKNPDGFFS